MCSKFNPHSAVMMSTMFDDTPAAPSFRIGDCLVDPNTNRIQKNGHDLRVEPKVMKVLEELAAAGGTPLSREILLERVWGDTLVTENSLTQAISKLRKILEDTGDARRVIETISKKGYRLTVPVEVVTRTHTVNGQALSVQETTTSNLWIYIVGLLTIAGFCSLYFFGIFQPEMTTGQKAQSRVWPLTTEPGIERQPTYIANDQMLVFGRDSIPYYSNLFVRDLKTGYDTRLTFGPGVKRFPRYVASRNEVVFVKQHNSKSAIFAVPARGGEERHIADLKIAAAWGMDAFANAEKIAYIDQQSGSDIRAVFLYDGATGLTSQLSKPPADSPGDKFPAVSPDGKRLAFIREDKSRNEDIYLVDLASGKESQLTVHQTRVSGLDWSADSREVIYCMAKAGGPVMLMRMRVPDGEPITLMTSIEGVGFHPSISTQNDKIAFESWVYSTNIYTKSLKASGDSAQAQAFSQSTRSDWNPQYSPDGERVAFISDRSGVPMLWIADAEGQSARSLSNVVLTYRPFPPKWSGDGRFLAIESKVDGQNRIYLIDARTGNIEERLSDATAPGFSRDGKWLYYAFNEDGLRNVWRREIKEGTAEKVTTFGAYVSQESLDGDFIYFSKLKKAGLWRQALDDNSVDLLIAELQTSDTFNWTVHDHGIYYIRRDLTYRPFLYLLDVETQEHRRIAELVATPFYRSFGLDISPDGQTAIFGQASQFESDLMWIAYEP